MEGITEMALQENSNVSGGVRRGVFRISNEQENLCKGFLVFIFRFFRVEYFAVC